MHWGENNYVQIFWWGNPEGKFHFGRTKAWMLRTILKWIFREMDRREGNVFIWLRTGKGGGGCGIL
jgi:hypothetical protein